MLNKRKAFKEDFDAQLIKVISDNCNRHAIEGIINVETKLHYLRLSGYYNYVNLIDKLGKIKIDDNSPRIMNQYRKQAYKKFDGGYLTIFFDPKEPFFPPCFLQTAASKKPFLIKIAHLLPELHVSLVEYAVDIFCRNNLYAEILFWALSRSAYAPYKDRSELYGGQQLDDNRWSAVMRIEDIKIYERGEDDKKQNLPGCPEKSGWQFKDINRVRIEYAAEGYMLKEKKIHTLEDLIRAPKFRDIFSNRIKFRKFKDFSPRFPSYWENYFTKNMSGTPGFFQEEYVKAKESGVLNLQQYHEDDEAFNGLVDMIQEKITQFDVKWNMCDPEN